MESDGMKAYRVYVHPKKPTAVVVKVGFSWPAFIIGPLWFLLNGMWLKFLIVTAFFGGAHLCFQNAQDSPWLPLLLLIYLVTWYLIGKWANALLGDELRTDGYQVTATVHANNASEAREKAGGSASATDVTLEAK
jgi:hypothetical protein